MNKDLNVLILNDLCSYGKASLTVNIPILSYFGIKVSPLVSVILSNHTAFESFCAFNLTEQLENIIKELKIRNPKFDAFYIGWIDATRQKDIVIDIINSFKIERVIIDPILGDYGKLYPSISSENVIYMKSIIKYADIIMPNITELAILLNKDPTLNYTEKEIINMCKELSQTGSKTIIVTSVIKENSVGCLYYRNNDIITSYYPKINVNMAGTGDAFGSSFLGYILKGYSIKESLDKATKFVYISVKKAIEDNDDILYGIAVEKRLNLLN